MVKNIVLTALLSLPLAISTILAVATAAVPCTLGKQFWDETKSKCIPCTVCVGQDIIVRMCQAHKDTVCGPLSKLGIDWSNIIPVRSHRVNDTGGHGHKKNHHRKKAGHKKVRFEDLLEDYNELDSEVKAYLEEDEDEMDSLESDAGLVGPPTIAFEEKSPPITNSDVNIRTPFSTTEYLVWDWQVAALFGGAAACVLLLAVLIFLTVYQLCGWHRTKEPIPDPEEESLRASLFPHEQREYPDSGSAYHSNQCLYLEQLLERKGKCEESGSNVYVEDGMPPS